MQIELTLQQIQIILAGLGELPAKHSTSIILEINRQVAAANTVLALQKDEPGLAADNPAKPAPRAKRR